MAAAKKSASVKGVQPSVLGAVTLVHWNEAELPVRIAALRPHAKRIHTLSQAQATGLTRSVRDAAVDALVIDLSRLPAHGAELAKALRQSPVTRRLPLLFVGGLPEKVERVRSALPDATFGDWTTIASDLARAITSVPAEPVRPLVGIPAYAGRSLPQKLGIKAGSRVLLVDAPDALAALLATQVADATYRRDARGAADVALWFVPDLATLTRGLPRWAARDDIAGLWICWPKRASGRQTDLGESLVRERGLAVGLVDYKICAVDDTWSGLKFAWRGRAKVT
jgi:CheY-like chemotaxis protein